MTNLNAIKYVLSLPCDPDESGDAAVLERMRLVCDKLGLVKTQLKYIHICGDVGKDSCTQMISSVMRLASYKVGIYSVCHGNDPTHNLVINGRIITYDDFTSIIHAISKIYRSEFKTVMPSRHEIMTLAAIKYFCDNGCDVCIFEKPGGKNDPVNLTEPPLITLITPFTERYAEPGRFENIIHRGTSETVSSPQHKEIFNAISDTCAKVGSRLTIPIYSDMEITNITLFKTYFRYRGIDYSVRSFSPCQTVNAITAIETANALARIGLDINESTIVKGISAVSLEGKCETVSVSPTVILSSTCEKERLDTLLASLAQVKEYFSEKTDFFVDSECGMDLLHFSSALAAYGISNQSISILPAQSLESKSFRLSNKSIFADLMNGQELDSTTIFIGRREFITAVKSYISSTMYC